MSLPLMQRAGRADIFIVKRYRLAPRNNALTHDAMPSVRTGTSNFTRAHDCGLGEVSNGAPGGRAGADAVLTARDLASWNNHAHTCREKEFVDELAASL